MSKYRNADLLTHLARHDAPCVGCGYNLRGQRAQTCPECGRAIVLAELRDAELLGMARAPGKLAPAQLDDPDEDGSDREKRRMSPMVLAAMITGAVVAAAGGWMMLRVLFG